MSSMKALFEKEIKNKLSLKASGHQSEETVLLKAFKYFDLDNSGECSRDEFFKTVAKIGISGFTEKNLAEVFDSFDLNHNDSLDYKEFVGSLYGNTSISKKAGEEEKKTQQPSGKKNNYKDGSKFSYLDQEEIKRIIGKIREKLIGRGIRGIISIGKAFKIMDDNNSKTLEIDEFTKAANDYRWELTQKEVELAFNAFDEKNNGSIDYEEFLRTIRGNMNDFRKNLCIQAFKLMDKDGSGELDINDIRGTYNAKMHPDVKAGKKTEDEVFMEYLETFEAHHNMMSGQGADHIISLEEWIEYYQNVSMSIDDDAYFELMMNNCWKMNKNTTYNNNKKGWSNKDEEGKNNRNVQDAYQQKSNVVSSGNPGRSNESSGNRPVEGGVSVPSNSAMDKFRTKLLSRGAKGIIGLQRQFKIFDDNNSKSLDLDEFIKACKDFKIDLSQTEIKLLFSTFDRDGQGSVDYEEFLRNVRGEMNDRRRKLALQAFDKLDTDKSGILEINDIKYIYNAKMHPDVKSGKKTEEDVFGEFLETFETHHNILKGTRDRRITKEEWVEYYNNVSMSIDSDDYFETMMVNAWKLNGQVTYAKGWVGDSDSRPQTANRGGNGNSGKQQVYQNAPFGVSEGPTNYSTSNKKNSAGKPGANNFSAKGDSILIKFREKISARGTRGIFGIRRSFMIADDNNSKSIDAREFAKLLKDYRYEINDSDVKKLFDIFDQNKSGELDYEEFLRGVVGEMNDFRKGICKKAFAKMDKNGNGSIELDDIRGVYNAKQHPDVKSGKKTEDEILAEFLDNFEYHFSLLNQKGTKDRSISVDEWFEYYNHISMSVEEDKYFEAMMNSCWNLDNSKGTYSKGWKGEY